MDKYEIKPTTAFQDVVMPEYFRTTVMECIYLPMYFPELFNNARRFCRGFLVFGPPGVGKSYVTARVGNAHPLSSVYKRPRPCLTSYRVDAGGLMSPWSGDSERIIRDIFTAARENEPSIIIIEDLSELTSREDESDYRLRIKTELLVQIDSTLNSSALVWVIGVTQLPCNLPSFRRRLWKRFYMTMPDQKVRLALIKENVTVTERNLTERDLERLAILTQGLTCSDIVCFMREVPFKPLRAIREATHFRKVNDKGETICEGDTGTHMYRVCDSSHPDAEAMRFDDLEPEQIYLPLLTMADHLQVLETVKSCVTREDIAMYDQFAMDYTGWKPKGERKKKPPSSLGGWCFDVICDAVCHQTWTDLHALVATDLPLPEKLRLQIIAECAERLDLWINENKERECKTPQN